MDTYPDFIEDPPQKPDTSDFVPDEPTVEMSGMKKIFKANIAAAKPENPQQHEASTYKDDFLSGWQQSTAGLGIRGSLPDTVLPEHAPMLARMLSMGGNFVGDVPAMVAGFVGGGAAGTAVAGPAGTAAGSMMGAFALPAAIRQVLVDHYKKGDLDNFEDFRDRAMSVLHETIKGSATGLAVSFAGPLAGKALSGVASPLAKASGMIAAEAATMTTVGSAMEGKVPKAQDFIDNAVFMSMMHGVTEPLKSIGIDSTKEKLMDVYAKTGVEPHQVTDLASQDMVLRQELLSKDPGIPESLKGAVDPSLKEDLVNVQPSMSLQKSADGLASYKVDGPEDQLKVSPLSDKDNPSVPPLVGNPKARSAAVNAILDRIGEQPDAPKESLDFNKLYYNLIDKNDPLKNMTESILGKEALGTKDDPYGLARSFGSVARKADEIIENGPRDFETLKKTGTPGLSAIWDKADDLKELRAYQIAKHSIDLSNNGIETGVPLEEAKSTVKELGPKYAAIAKENVKFNNDNIDYLVDSGILDKTKAQIMKDKWQNYSAMNRVMGTDEQTSGGSGNGLVPYNPLKSIEGSERQIIDPLQSNIKNTHQIIAMAEKNRVMSALTDMIDSQLEKGDKSWGTKAKTPMLATDLKGEEISKILQKQGFSPEEAENLNDVSTIFRADRQPLADDQIASYKDGKRQVYEGVPKGILDAVKGMDAQGVNALTKMLSPPSMLLREGMMSSPAFAVRHFFRQEVLATSLSKDMHIPVYETIKGMAGMMGDKEAFGDWIMHGGAGDSIGSIDNDYIKSKIYDLNEKTGFLDNGFNKVKNGLQFSKHAIELTDEARTFQKYQNRLSSGDVSDAFQAQFQARDTGIDVQRSGGSIATYAKLDPFQNIRIQGLDLIARRLKEDPLSVVPKLLATITLPSMALWYINHEKDWYKNLTDQDRDTNWHFEVGDPDNGGHVVRVPKPFEPGVVFGALPERIMDSYFSENPHAFKNFGKTITDSVAPGYVPTFAQPIIEAFANKSMLTNSPLISKNKEGMLPAYQVNTYTSDAAKIIASGLRQIPLAITQNPGTLGSPIVVDNFVKNWTGGVGQLVLSATDKILEKSGLADQMGVDYNHSPPESVWSDNPFLRSFILRYPSTNTKAIGDFFDRFNEVQSRIETIKKLGQQGDLTHMQKETQSAMDEDDLVPLAGFKKTISEQMSLIEKVTVMPGMDPTQKRQQIDQLATSVNKVAGMANQMMDQMDKVQQQRKK